MKQRVIAAIVGETAGKVARVSNGMHRFVGNDFVEHRRRGGTIDAPELEGRGVEERSQAKRDIGVDTRAVVGVAALEKAEPFVHQREERRRLIRHARGGRQQRCHWRRPEKRASSPPGVGKVPQQADFSPLDEAR